MGQLHDRAAWLDGGLPERVVDALASWLEDDNYDLYLDGWFTDGRSGSPVARVVREQHHDRATVQLVLKFCDIRGRAMNLRQARAESEHFKNHLAEVENQTLRLGDWRAVYMRVAGGNLDPQIMPPLTNLYKHPHFPSYCATIVHSVVSQWNRNILHRIKTITTIVLDGMMGRRRSGAEQWAHSSGIALEGSPYVELPGGWPRPLRNPFLLLATGSDEGRRPINHLMVGKAHGDLSGRNILVPARPAVEAASFTLIDYDRFSNQEPLTRDPMHLLVALALDKFDGFDPRLRTELADVLVNPYAQRASSGLTDIRKISAAIHTASKGLAEDNGLGATWDLQCLLSLVGVGLVHLGRRLYTNDQTAAKQWCFYLASVAADEYLRKLLVLDPTQIVASKPIPVSSGITPGSLVDRKNELVSLRNRLTSGPGGVVVLRGTRGVGKTMLVDVALAGIDTGVAELRIYRHDVNVATQLDARTLIDYVAGEADTAVPYRHRGSALVRLEAALRRVGDSRVLVAVDAAENLLNRTTNELADPELDDALELIATEQGHRVTVLLVTRHDLVSPADGIWPMSEPPITVNMLSRPDFFTYLFGLDRIGRLATASLPDNTRSALYDRLRGNPRLADLTYASVAAENGPDFPALIGYLLAYGTKDVPTFLTRLLLGVLNPMQRRVLEALAAFDTPVPQAAVVELLDGEDPQQIAQALAALVAHRIVYRAKPDLYFVPPEDNSLIMAEIPDKTARSDLYFSAATTLTQLQNRAPLGVPDLRIHFAEMRALLRSGEPAAAYNMIQATDDVLREWNCSSLLRKQREEVRGSLGDDFLEMANENALGGIYVSRGWFENANKAYGRALGIANKLRDDLHRMKIHVNLAAMYWEQNDTDRALGYFELARDEAERLDDPMVRMGALEGVADCCRRRGHYDQAIRYGNEALAIPGRVDYPDTPLAQSFASSRNVAVALKLARWYGELGKAHDATRLIEVAYVAAGRRRDDWLRASCLDGRAGMLFDRDELGRAESDALEAEELALQLQDPITLLQARTTLCFVYLKTDRTADARRAIEGAWRYRRQPGRSLVVLALRALMTRLTGDPLTANQLFRLLSAEAAARIERDAEDFAAHDFQGFAICGMHLDTDRDLDDAISAFRSARQLAPPTPVLVNRLRLILLRLDQPGQGRLQPAIDALYDT